LKESRVYLQWAKTSLPKFRAAVSLHSHTFHSLDFIERATAKTPCLAGAVRKQRLKYRESQGRDLDLKRAWWTPPLSPYQAWNLETTQIEQALGMEAIVSISDHDNIHAGTNLRVLEKTRECPISIEWTVPFRRTFFHVGIHNLPARKANEMAAAMNKFTAAPDESQIAGLLEYLGASSESLTILNHPVWDESHIGEGPHLACLKHFLELFAGFIHALELNGLRPGVENRKTVEFAERFHLPVISGGDRHGREPNACVNLTAAASFGEFASDVRHRGESNVLFLQRYKEPLRVRILENVFDILEDDPNHALGWKGWGDRVFYRTDDGVARSLNELWGGNYPRVVSRFVSLMRFAKHRRVRSALRFALNENEEFAL